MELVENDYPEWTYCFKVEMAREYHPISSVNDSVIPIDVDPEFSSTFHPSCSTIGVAVGLEKKAKKKKEENWSSCKQKQNFEGLSMDQGNFILMKEFEDIFAINSFDLGKSDLIEQEINTGDCTTIKQTLRRIHTTPPELKRLLTKNWMNSLLLVGLNCLKGPRAAQQSHWLENTMELIVCVSTQPETPYQC